MKMGCLIVTFNRLEKLMKSLNAYDKQTMKPEVVIVVDNASTDGTIDFLKNWLNEKRDYKKEIQLLENNIGGSGGFYYGLKKIIDYDLDWILIADDDAYPSTDLLYLFSNYTISPNVAAVATKVIYEDGDIQYQHRRTIKYKGLAYDFVDSTIEDYKKDAFIIDCFSFVGTFVRKKVLLEIGFPEKDYFVQYDDTEFSLRVHSVGIIECIPKLVVVHDTSKLSEIKYTWRSYYSIRNKLLMTKKHFKLEIFLYCVTKQYLLSLVYFGCRRFAVSKLVIKATNDAIMNKRGLSEIYYPGFDIGDCK